KRNQFLARVRVPRRTILSSPAVAISCPFGENATDQIRLVVFDQSLSFPTVSKGRDFRTPSPPTLTRECPSRGKATRYTGPLWTSARANRDTQVPTSHSQTIPSSPLAANWVPSDENATLSNPPSLGIPSSWVVSSFNTFPVSVSQTMTLRSI